MKSCSNCGSPVAGYADTCGGLACRSSVPVPMTWEAQEKIYEIEADPDDPYARKGGSQAEARSRRWGWLTQADIDRPLPPQPRRSLRLWLEEVPGGWSTVIVIVAFFAGLWGCYLLYQLLTSPEAVKAVSTAGRG